MAIAGEGETSYRGGAGGKFKKQPARRHQKTPYDRPPSIVANPRPGGWVSKLFDPASKFISARAFKFFSNFRKRLTEGEQETREIPQEAPSTLVDCKEASAKGLTCNGHITNNSGGCGIADLVQMLQQNTFTRNEIDHLTELMHSRTMESSLHDEEKTNEGNLYKPVPDYRKGGVSQENKDDSNKFQGNVPATGGSLKVLEDDIASPAELAKAYMGRTSKVSPSMLGVRTQTIKEETPKSSALSLVSKSVLHDGVPERGLTTPRSRGRSAIYNMARTPYTRGTGSTKYIYGGGSSSPQSAWEHNGQYGSKQLALKRRSSVLDDDSRSVGAMRRIRQKPNLSYHASPLSARVTDFGYSSGQNHASADKPLLMDAGKTKVSKNCEESEDNSNAGSSYPLVHSQSRQMASKILQQLEKFTPQKSSESKLITAKDKSPIKLTPNMLHGQALRSLENADSTKFLQKQDGKRFEDCCNASPDAGGETSQKKNNIGENGFKNMDIPLKLTPSSAGTNSRMSMANAVPNIKSGESIVSEFAVKPHNKRGFRMTANEDFEELEDDIQTNGFVSVSSGERGEGLQTFRESVSSRVIAEEKISSGGRMHENVAASSTNDLKISDGFVAAKENIGAQTFSVGAPISNTPPAIHGQSTSVVDNSGPSREPTFSGVSSKNVDTFPPFTFSSSSPCGESTGPNPTSSFDARRQIPTSFGSDAQLNTWQSDEGQTKNTDGFEHLTQSSEKSTAAAVSAFSASAFVSSTLSADNPTLNNVLVDSSPFSQLIAPKIPLSNSTEQVGISSTIVHTPASVAVTSGSTSGSSIFTKTPSFPEALPTSPPLVPSQSVATPIFSFGSSKTESNPSATVSTTSGVGITEIKSNDVKDTLKLPSSGTLFGATNAANNSFGFSSSLGASSSSNQAQVSPSGFGSSSAASSLLPPTTGASTVAQSAAFQFGSSGSSTILGTSGTSFNANSYAASSSAPSNPFGSGTTPLSTAPASLFSITPNSSSGAISNVFSSSWQTSKAPVMGSVASSPSPSTLFSFGASNTASATSSIPILFGQSTGTSSVSTFSFTSPTATSLALPSLSQSQPVFGSSTANRASGNSGDQMNMEDSMAEDPVHSSNPSVSVFGQPLVPPSNPTVPVFGQPLSSSSNPTVPVFGQSLVSPSPPGFMFGSTAPQSALPFQFSGQQNQATPLIPSFQASNSGGSFSLGSGGGDKGSRKMVRVSKNRNRKK